MEDKYLKIIVEFLSMNDKLIYFSYLRKSITLQSQKISFKNQDH